MCGFVGAFGVRPIAEWVNAAALDAAVDTLAHRGPDDRSTYRAADGRAFLGHRRLAIIDVAGGRQPLVNETGRVRLTYNGEIYNYRELCAALAGRGHRLSTRSDGEAALHLYEERGAAFVRDLSGMFAVAVLDEAEGRLTLARDRNGIKPLYYHWPAGGDLLVFASELKAMRALLPRPPAMSRHGLAAYLRWKYVPDPLTIYEGIHKLPPGCVLTARRSDHGRLDVDVRRYWDLDYGGEKIIDEAGALEALDAALHEAVRSHLESDVEVGSLLSGGVDSSLVTALACRIRGRPIRTFSVGFREAGFDQLPYARRVAEAYGTEHTEELVELDPMAAAARVAEQFDEPFADSSALASHRVCEVAARHVKVVLTGDGGDETFAGYRRYEDVLSAATEPRDGVLAAGRRMVRAATYPLAAGLFSREAKFVRRARLAMLGAEEAHQERQTLFSRWLIQRILPGHGAGDSTRGDEAFERLRAEAAARPWSPMERAQWIDLRMYLPGDILTKVDRTSMACSLECRVPLLDHAVTELSARIAPELKVRSGVRKYLLKKLAERYVPRELLYRPKMGFRVPVRRWMKRGLLGETERLLLDGILVGRGILDQGGLRWVFRNQRRPWVDFGSQLWALLCLEQWARRWWDHGRQES